MIALIVIAVVVVALAPFIRGLAMTFGLVLVIAFGLLVYGCHQYEAGQATQIETTR